MLKGHKGSNVGIAYEYLCFWRTWDGEKGHWVLVGLNSWKSSPTSHTKNTLHVKTIKKTDNKINADRLDSILLSACATMETKAFSLDVLCPSVATCLAVPCCITCVRWGAMAWTSESSSSHPFRLSSFLPRNVSSEPPVTIVNGVLELNILGMPMRHGTETQN